MTARFGALGTFAKIARKNHQRMREGLDLLQKSPPYFDSPEYQDYRAKCLEAEMSSLVTVVFAAMAAEAYIYDLGRSSLP